MSEGQGDGKDSPRVHKPFGGWLLIWRLEGGFCIIPNDKWVWNVMFVSHDWKITSSKEDTISTLSIVFLATVTGGPFYIM